ncbi:MAG: NusG domain II-containing protein [Bacillota bacterium]|nr:NusG domain II-containing protein [Bacillota bacterium]
MKNKEKLRNDILLIILLLIAAGTAGLFMLFAGNPGNTVSVTVDGEEIMTLPLDEDTSIEIHPGKEKDDFTNTLTIKDGKAYISYADCPDQICVNRGGISYEDETIVCLPHRLVVTVTQGEKSETDGVSK